MMKLISVNVGEERDISVKSGTSGIFKIPTENRVFITKNGMTDDVIVDVDHHGGVDQAIYIYGETDYQWWSGELNRELPAGIFGDNLTISDLESGTLCVGDRLQVGEVLLEVTSPRIPCVTLATRMEDPKFVKRFTQAERFGAYCRVIDEGNVQVGDDVSLTLYDGDRISIVEFAHAYYDNSLTEAQIQRYLSVPVAIRGRDEFEEKLAKIKA